MKYPGKKLNSRIVVIFILSLLVGALLIVQIQNVAGRSLYVAASAEDDFKVTIAGEQQEVENLKQMLKETREKLETYETLQESEEDLTAQTEKQLREDTELYSMASGLREIKGAGISVQIDDETRELEWFEDPNDVLVHDTDLLIIINALKNAGAEAISVNGERIATSTAISCSGHTVRINGRTYARPFTINAVGDGSRMSAALIGPGCPGTILSDYVIFKVSTEDDLVIPALTGPTEYQFAAAVTADSETEAKEGEEN